MSISEVLQERRKALGLTITQAARLCGLPRAYLSMIESGKRAPSPQTVERVMSALSVPVEAWLPRYLGEESRCQQLIGLAQIFFDQGDYAHGREVLRRAFFVSRNEQDGRYNSEIYHQLGRICYEQGLYIRALRWYKLQDRAMKHRPQPRLQAIASYNLALCLAKLGERTEALRKFDDADERFTKLQMWGEVGFCSLWKANVLLALHAYREAFQAYRRAAHFLRRKPFHGDARLGLAITTAMLEGPAEAIPLFRALAEADDVSDVVRIKAHTNLASALRKLGRYEDALRSLDAGLSMHGEVQDALQAALLAEATICHMLCGDRDSALATFERYTRIEGPKDSEDIAAMNVVAGALGVEPPDESLPPVIEVDYEQRLKAAVQILQGTQIPGA